MSNSQVYRFEAQLGDDLIVFETGHLAQQANGAVLIRSGDSILLTTATASGSVREGIDFFSAQCRI
jgi:polyribonucleotide nucleotidyltransferase